MEGGGGHNYEISQGKNVKISKTRNDHPIPPQKN